MPTEIIKKRFTVADYHRMAEAGILGPKERVELIDGEIVEMSPTGHPHWVRVARATTLFIRTFGDRAVVNVQNPIQLTEWTEPEPDLVVYKPRPDFYLKKKPAPEDVFFLMEISDTSLRYDRNVKVPLFAAAGIPEVWIQDVKSDVLYVYREPQRNGYGVTLDLRRNDIVSPTAFPDVQFSIDNLLGEPIPE
jgi:Uma2 family endonuclease